MPIRNTKGIALSEPGGALRADVLALGPQVTILPDGLFASASYGGEASMYSLNRGTGNVATTNVGACVPIPFSVVTVDTCDVGLPQCEAESGVLTAQQNGLYEIGCQALVTGGMAHLELGIYTDLGYPGLALAPAVAFGSVGVAGTAWFRVGQKTKGIALATTPSTDPEAPGHLITCTTQWLVSTLNVNSGQQFAPTRFRFGIRPDTNCAVVGFNPRNTYCWLRQLRP